MFVQRPQLRTQICVTCCLIEAPVTLLSLTRGPVAAFSPAPPRALTAALLWYSDHGWALNGKTVSLRTDQGRANPGKILCTQVTLYWNLLRKNKLPERCWTSKLCREDGLLIELCQTCTKARVLFSQFRKYSSGLESLGKLVTCQRLLMI